MFTKTSTVSHNWIRGFQAAKAASLHSNAPRLSLKMGAAIFAKSNLIAVGFNTYGQTHPNASYEGYNRNIHAEHKAILKRQYYSNGGLVLYTYRETADGLQACSKPCQNCQEIIRESGIRKVRYIGLEGTMEEMEV